MIKSEKQEYCIGCEDNFYNGGNPYDIKECWNLKSARLVNKKKISIHQQPPWTQKPIKVFNCFQQRGYVFWEPDRTC